MAAIYAILSAIDRINDWLGRKLSLLLLIIFGILLMEVIRRYVFNSPTVWANELVQMLFGAYVVLSAGYILRWDGHVNVDIISSLLPPRAKALMDIITSLLSFLFCGVLLYYGVVLAWDSLSRWEHSESAWNPPVYPINLMIPTGALLLLLQVLAKFIRDLLALFNKDSVANDQTHQKEVL